MEPIRPHRLGWVYEHERVCDAFRTGHGHVLWASKYVDSLGAPDACFVLTFANSCPQDPEDPDDDSWDELMQDWGELPGWQFTTAPSQADFGASLTQAASVVESELGPPERIVPADDDCLGPPMQYRVWRTRSHALVVGACPDNGPFGYLTMGVAALRPWRSDDPLPAGDRDILNWLKEMHG
ncbi:hypothetical protein ACQEVG_30120 [Streptomyces sp. CA-135486]|uniref:hypothetical protein n=1 Tax=Streptomyces sp. CA-135486 TaxID=3240049 RepID=UPI003D94CF70